MIMMSSRGFKWVNVLPSNYFGHVGKIKLNLKFQTLILQNIKVWCFGIDLYGRVAKFYKYKFMCNSSTMKNLIKSVI